MELDKTGWPQLPTVGSKVQFNSGEIFYQSLGVCTIVRADHVHNSSGKPGGRVELQTDNGQRLAVALRQLREHGVLVE